MNLAQEEWWAKAQEDQNAVILDVRTDEECSEGIIPNAVIIDIYKSEEFVSKIGALDKSKNYYVYCRSGGRSRQACSIMNQWGFEATFNLDGGFMNWNGPVSII
ncbi:MAG: hypothetical protein RL494_1403 [Bacteroidota bacterium]|jgi:rhodanese-related sulfurtransferase